MEGQIKLKIVVKIDRTELLSSPRISLTYTSKSKLSWFLLIASNQINREEKKFGFVQIMEIFYIKIYIQTVVIFQALLLCFKLKT